MFPSILALRWPLWLSKAGLARLIPRVYLLGGAGKLSDKGTANPSVQSETEGNLKLLGPIEKLSEPEFSCNRKGMDRVYEHKLRLASADPNQT